MLLPLLALIYAASSPSSYSATARISVYSGGPDSLVPSTQITGAGLSPDIATVRTLRVAEAAVERLPGLPPIDRSAFVKAAEEVDRQLKVRLGANGATLDVTATASSPERAAAIANAVAGGFLQVRGAEAQNVARAAVTDLLEANARLPAEARARQAAILAARARLEPLLTERQVQVVAPAVASSRPLLVTAVAAAIALLAVVALMVARAARRAQTKSTDA
jgi:hypothetical protein